MPVWKIYSIEDVMELKDENDEVIGHTITLDFPRFDISRPVVSLNLQDKSFPYRVTFLDEGSAENEWGKLLEKWDMQELGTFDSGKWTFRSISSSRVHGLTPSILK